MVPAGIAYDLDLRNGDTWRSDGLERVLGFALEDVAGTERWWEQRLHPEDARRVARDGLLLTDPAISTKSTGSAMPTGIGSTCTTAASSCATVRALPCG